ncbi:hypothetical protein TVAG_374700 [Trichomonas vaginalis G3]|uniref:Uncharacterized protein n=1 Tax=Trichomonas vaginalis (strain ATCC PRA-98 / G3) TaxID=412133 RepID=A2FCI3_TRIV3|nr:hypothetical protein TVAGG3_0151480 [Trichomonas vaginalis G3]EAX97389.1 hypothetical protein TVAG_374700 [Trichomonas vaginalis G3]KAI5547297.1 hypothetical protein TVAGG3_0151480 [Trichomonas vaginalis G3]|eukprot:XP_001310319.1 hypothetical protein [Trichomonas vaginalis G3]
MLYQGIKALTTKFAQIKNEVNFLNNQLLNVDDAVQNYLSRNPITVYTQDGQKMDDALGDIDDRIQSVLSRISRMEQKHEKFEDFMTGSLKPEEIKDLKVEIKQASKMSNDTTEAIQAIHQKIQDNAKNADDKINAFKEYISKQNEVTEERMATKVDKEEMNNYISTSNIAELIMMFKSMPQSKQVRIPDIIPQVFSESKLSNDEKVQRCFELLNIERNRVNKEQAEIINEFSQLKRLASSVVDDDDNAALSPENYERVEVRDIGCDSGVTEASEPKATLILRKYKKRTVATNFDGPQNCDSTCEKNKDELIEVMDENIKNAPSSSAIDTAALTAKVLEDVEGEITEKLTAALTGIGSNLQRGDIITILDGLKNMEDIKKDIGKIKLNLEMKVDKSIAKQEFDSYVRRDEFFSYMETGNLRPHAYATTTREPPVRSTSRSGASSKTVVTPRKKTQSDLKGPLPLVPARNSKMLGVNDKYAVGDDGKMYFKELGETLPATLTNRSAKTSYYERSKSMMENENGIETVLDFQPFVPLDSQKNNSPKD